MNFSHAKETNFIIILTVDQVRNAAMTRLSGIFNFVTTICVFCGFFVNGRETTVEERKSALSTLFGELDKFLPVDEQVQASFNQCCDKYTQNGEFDQFKLNRCTVTSFLSCAAALQRKVQDFIGEDEVQAKNRETLLNVLNAYELALNDPTKDVVTTDKASGVLSTDIEEWKKTMAKGEVTFYDSSPDVRRERSSLYGEYIRV